MAVLDKGVRRYSAIFVQITALPSGTSSFDYIVLLFHADPVTAEQQDLSSTMGRRGEIVRTRSDRPSELGYMLIRQA